MDHRAYICFFAIVILATMFYANIIENIVKKENLLKNIIYLVGGTISFALMIIATLSKFQS